MPHETALTCQPEIGNGRLPGFIFGYGLHILNDVIEGVCDAALGADVIGMVLFEISPDVPDLDGCGIKDVFWRGRQHFFGKPEFGFFELIDAKRCRLPFGPLVGLVVPALF